MKPNGTQRTGGWRPAGAITRDGTQDPAEEAGEKRTAGRMKGPVQPGLTTLG